MDARIRYGSEAAIYKALGNREFELTTLMQAFERPILSFSQSVRHLPDEPGFEPLLSELGIAYYPDELEHGKNPQDEPTLPGMRVIELVELPPADNVRTKMLGDGLIRLVVRSDSLGHEGVVFIDHTTNPDGIIISQIISN